MWRVGSHVRYPLPDLHRFVEMINDRPAFFDPSAPITVARAPGRLDLMGGIADYSGALVLQLPLSVATFAAVQRVDEPIFTVLSTNAAEISASPTVAVPMGELTPERGPLVYTAVRRLLTAQPERSWAAYVAGTLVALHREKGIRFDGGLRVLIHSDVPTGKAVSSSAALEVATMQAICGAIDYDLGGREIALLCQIVENHIVGAPCGIMDQMTATCGEADRLLALLCQPAELEAAVPLPDEIEVWGIDSGIRHAVSGADYGSVRAGAFMGYRIIAAQLGLAVSTVADGRVRIDDPCWRGYLANIAPSEWAERFRNTVPEAITGADFLAQYGGFTDHATTIDPRHIYAVRHPAAHPIYENHRVRLFRALLHSPLDEERLRLLGELMYQSHASYSACGLGSDGTDRLVDMVRAAGPRAGLYGAKITGGGSGGTVAVLARRGALVEVQRIAQRYRDETGRRSLVLGGSSPGSVQFGIVRLWNTTQTGA